MLRENQFCSIGPRFTDSVQRMENDGSAVAQFLQSVAINYVASPKDTGWFYPHIYN